MKSILVILLLLSASLKAQEITNLEAMNSLLENLCADISQKCDQEIVLINRSPSNLIYFNSRIEQFFTENGKTVSEDENSYYQKVVINIENAVVNYKDIEKDGFLGDYYINREITLTGNYIIKQNDKIKLTENIYLTQKDSVNYDNINKIENYSLPFTRGTLPSEPLTPSLLEPIIAVSSAVLTIILFFTVRSK